MAVIGRTAVVAIMIGGFAAATIGYPLVASKSTSSGRPFPCQHHQCGCESADACWSHCCCFSAAEKLAWAERNRVLPPAADDLPCLAEPSTAAVDLDHRLHDVANSSDHADRLGHEACCHVVGCPDEPTSAGESEMNRLGSCRACAEPTPGGRGVRFVVPSLVRFCRSLPSLWITTGAVVLAPAASHWEFDWALVSVCPSYRPTKTSYCWTPPVPPPRSLAIA